MVTKYEITRGMARRFIRMINTYDDMTKKLIGNKYIEIAFNQKRYRKTKSIILDVFFSSEFSLYKKDLKYYLEKKFHNLKVQCIPHSSKWTNWEIFVIPHSNTKVIAVTLALVFCNLLELYQLSRKVEKKINDKE